MEKDTKILDFIGIGFGPANISLAIQLQENNLEKKLSYLFIESNKDSLWQKEMIIDGADIQNIPFKDLITPINPQSYYSFINYLHKNDRFFKYFGTGLKYPLRLDYAMYINWCASHFKEMVHYRETVLSIEISDAGQYYTIKTTQGIYFARIVILATGRSLYIPDIFKNIPQSKLITINNFKTKMSKLKRLQKYKFAVIGASQSAVEVILELSKNFPKSIVHSYIRKYSFVIKDSSPFSFEIYAPDFIDEYYNASNKAKIFLNNHLRRANYSSADSDVLDKMNIKIYEDTLNGRKQIEIKNNTEILNITDKDNILILTSRDVIKNVTQTSDYDFVVVCTGFKDLGANENYERLPPLLTGLTNELKFNDNESMAGYISKNYEIFFNNIKTPIYLNGLCETSHGMGDAGSLGLVAVRVNRIVKTLTNYV